MGNIHPRHQFQPRDNRTVIQKFHASHADQIPVDAETHGKPVFPRFHVDIAGISLIRLFNNRIHRAHQRRTVYAFRGLPFLFFSVYPLNGLFQLFFRSQNRHSGYARENSRLVQHILVRPERHGDYNAVLLKRHRKKMMFPGKSACQKGRRSWINLCGFCICPRSPLLPADTIQNIILRHISKLH